MINNPRFILPLDGAATVSSGNSNIINVTSGTTPDATIDLLALNGNGGSPVLVSTPTSCTFDVYSINTTFTPDDTDYLCSNGTTDGDGYNTNLPGGGANNIFSFRDQFIFYNGNGIATTTNTNSEFVESSGAGVNAAHCHFVITGNSCESFDFNGNSPVYLQDATGNDIQNIDNTGIKFTCGANDINYKYDNFDVSLENNCYNPSAKSYLVFTPKTEAIGLQELGNGLFSIPLFIDNVEKQTGDFYFTPGCDATDTLYTALNDVVFGFHSSN